MTHDVFISYSNKDKKIADAICSILEGNKIRCWIAPRDVRPGSSYAEAIVDSITGSHIMVLVFSSQSNISEQVYREVERAVSKGITIIPFRIEDVPLSKTMEYFISSTHWLDALSAPLEQHIAHLADTIKLILYQKQSGPFKREPDDKHTQGSDFIERNATAQTEDETTPRKRSDISLSSALSKNSVGSGKAERPFEVGCFPGHEGTVCSVIFLPGGGQILSGSTDRTIRLWDIREKEAILCFKDVADIIYSLAVSKNGKWFLFGSSNRLACLYEIESQKKLRVFEGHQGGVMSVGFPPKGIYVISGSWDQTIRLWDPKSGKDAFCLEGHEGPINCVKYAHDGHYIISCSSDTSIRLWSVPEKKQVLQLDGHGKSVNSVAFLPDDNFVVSGGDDGSVRVWELWKQEEVACLKGHKGKVRCVAVSPSGEIISGGDDKTIRLWDIPSGSEKYCYRGHEDAVYCLDVSHDGNLFVSGGKDKTVRLWKFPDASDNINPVMELRQ